MTRYDFQQLTQKVIYKVGERAFKSKSYIDDLLKRKYNIYMAHEITSGGCISGEVKLAIIPGLLTGDTTLDLGVIFIIKSSRCTKI